MTKALAISASPIGCKCSKLSTKGLCLNATSCGRQCTCIMVYAVLIEPKAYEKRLQALVLVKENK